MKKILKTVSMLFLGWFLYTFIFSVLVFNVPLTATSDIVYDVEAMMSRDDSVAGTYATVVDDNAFALNSRLAMIESAEEAIDISYYSIHDGYSRDVFFYALHEAAERGVSIRIIIDGVFYPQTFRDKDALDALTAHENVRFKLFEPYNPALPHAIQNILHDKLMIVDDVYGMTGGRNIGDRFFKEGVEGGYSSTYDRDILIHSETGPHPTVTAMRTYYDELFHHAYSEPYEPDTDNDHTEALENMQAAMHAHRTEQAYTKDAVLSRIDEKKVEVENATFVHGPLNRMHKDPVVFETLCAIAENSETWFIQSPYIVFSNLMRERMPEYDSKDITVLTNNMVDNTNLFAVSGYRRYREDIAAHSTLYEYQGDMTIHGKTMTFDDDISVIGSFNLDPRSVSLSTESVIVVVSKDFQDSLNAVIDSYLQQSLAVDTEGSYIDRESVTPAELTRGRRWLLRALSALTYFFDPML